MVTVLARIGLPTSLTLATIGGITGSGVGAGRSVGWEMVGTVLVLAAVAPLAGGVVTVIALGVSDPGGGMLAVLAVLFFVGTLWGVRRMAGTIGTGVLPVRPLNAVTAEVAAGGAVLGTAFLGAPVSMTQAVAGALVGSGVSEGVRRVRWRLVVNIGAAWMSTLPAALLAAAAMAAIVEATL